MNCQRGTARVHSSMNIANPGLPFKTFFATRVVDVDILQIRDGFLVIG